MKKSLIVANWKMNLNVSESSALLHRLSERIKIYRDVEVVLAPNTLSLQPLSMQLDRRKFRLAAQNAYFKDDGPFTGEVSFSMLRDLVHYVIVGHSDRRYKFNEDLPTIREKVTAAVRNGITPIICVGETKQEKLDKETMQVIHDQVSSVLTGLTSQETEDLVITYEPVWALSDGHNYSNHETPTPEVIGKVNKTIRDNVKHLFGKEAADNIRVLYGGSVNASSAKSFLAVDGVDGLLVGGASLNYEEFSGIVNAAYQLSKEGAGSGTR